MSSVSRPGSDARLTLQFHPDWPHAERRVVESMAADGRYRSQFATGTSNGGLTAHPGGDRWRWESRLFAGRYDDVSAEERPLYGAWNRHGDPYGGSVRFGSAYLLLRPAIVERATFCFPDSVFEPDDVGGADLLPRLCALADSADRDPLDDYVEAHVHGPARFADDAEAVVLDPCFADGPVAEAAGRLGCDVRFHPGFRVASADVDPAYRGPEIAVLAGTLATELTPDVIGAAAARAATTPSSSSRSGTAWPASDGAASPSAAGRRAEREPAVVEPGERQRARVETPATDLAKTVIHRTPRLTGIHAQKPPRHCRWPTTPPGR